MTLVWVFVLVVYGIFCGFDGIHPLFWWSLVPWVLQDWYDMAHKGSSQNWYDRVYKRSR